MAQDGPGVFGYIYLIRNTINGKIYIGQTIQTLGIRWSQHCSPKKSTAKSSLHNAIRKYGPESFEMVEIGRANNQGELDEMERREIAARNSTNRKIGYNLTEGGGGVSGYVFSPESRRKVGEAAKAMWTQPGFKEAALERRVVYFSNPDNLAKHKQAMNIFSQDESYKDVHRENTTALWQDEEYQRKQRAGMQAVMATTEYKDKVSASSLAKWQDEEFRAKQTLERQTRWQDSEKKEAMLSKRRASVSGRSEEYAAEIKEAQRKELLERSKSPEYKQKLSDASKAKWADPEYRKRHAEAMRIVREKKEQERSNLVLRAVA